jgi:hypothetical protein
VLAARPDAAADALLSGAVERARVSSAANASGAKELESQAWAHLAESLTALASDSVDGQFEQLRILLSSSYVIVRQVISQRARAGRGVRDDLRSRSRSRHGAS